MNTDAILLSSPQSSFIFLWSNNFSIVPASNWGSHVAFSCNASFVSFNWDQFQWCAAKLDYWEKKKKKALVCSGCQFLWCKYSHSGQLHGTNLISLSTVALGREACNWFSRVSEPMTAFTDYLCLFLYFITTIWFFKSLGQLLCRMPFIFGLFDTFSYVVSVYSLFGQECHRSDAVFFAVYHSRRHMMVFCLITRDTRRDVTFCYAVSWCLTRFLPCKDKLYFIP